MKKLDEEMAEPEKDAGVINSVVGFTQNTSFHGIKYIGEDTKFPSRRILWIFVVLSVSALFISALIDRLLTFYSYPSNIELKVGYVKHLDFPTVTICNQNPYSLVPLQKSGLYDVITRTYRSLEPTVITQDSSYCTESYVLNPVVCTIPSHITYNMIHYDMTISVCEELCTNYSRDSCSGFLYDKNTKSCTLTSYTGEDIQWFTKEAVDKAKVDCMKKQLFFFRRIRCTDDSDILCNFEDGSSDLIYADKCRFDHGTSDTVSEYWVKVQGGDNTFGSAAGSAHYLSLFETDQRKGNIAQIVTPYLNTTGKCFMAHTTIVGPAKGTLKVILQTESLNEMVILKLGSENYTSVPEWTKLLLSMHEGRDHWISLYSPLPDGLHRVIIEGTRADSGVGGIHVDDIKITKCTSFAEECVKSPRGINYLGKINKTKQGKDCLPWLLGVMFFSPGIVSKYNHLEDYASASIFMPDKSLADASNYCRQPTKGDWTIDFLAPVCYDGKAYVECDVPRCTCDNNEFQCTDGECVHSDLVCDGKSDCMDNSDETDICKHKNSITCDFEDSYLCGYANLDKTFTWNKVYDTTLDQLNGNAHSLQMTNYKQSTEGESATVTSPYVAFPINQHVTLRIKMQQRQNVNGFYIRIAGSYGLTSVPVFSLGTILPGTNISLEMYQKLTYGWVEADLCVPGGPGIVQRLLMQSVYNNVDDFAIDSINITGQSCNPIFTAFPAVDNVDCNFENDICEYTEISGHINLMWKRDSSAGVLSKMEITGASHLGELDSSISHVLFLKYDGSYSTKQFISRLIAPISTFKADHCLSFYYIKKSEFSVRLEGLDGNDVTLFNDSRLSIYPVWSRVMLFVNNDRENVHIVFYGMKSTFPYLQYIQSVAQIERRNSSCWDVINKDADRSAACDFEDVHQCGYLDMSDQPSRWVRDSIKFQGVVGGVMRYGAAGLMDLTDVGRLVSPLVNIKKAGSLTVHLAGAQRICIKIQLENTTSHVIKELINRCIHYTSLDSRKYNSTRILTAIVPEGEYSVVLLASMYQKSHFPSSYIYVDNITITGNCMSKEFPCANGKCIPWSQKCDGIDQCGDNFDEQKCKLSIKIQGYQNYKVNVDKDCDGMSLSVNLKIKYFNDCGDECNADKDCQSFVFSGFTCTLYHMCGSVVSSKGSTLYTKPIIGKKRKRSLQGDTPSTVRNNTELHFTNIDNIPANKEHLTDEEIARIFNYSVRYMDVEHSAERKPAKKQKRAALQVLQEVTTESTTGNVTVHNDTRLIHVTDLYLQPTEWIQLIISTLDLDTQNFTKSISHKYDDFLLSCVWNSQSCTDNFVKQYETDMGHCISFNKGNNLISKRSGLLYGLQLTLNVEDYQSVEGIGQDSGIKIHFHSANEVPILRSMGYAVSPGSRTLFNLQYSKSSYLEPPHGTCGRKELSLYPKAGYTTSHCLSQCDANIILQKCKCTPSYVTGTEDSCDLDTYLTCVLINERNDNGSECVCPDACHQVVYDAQLSYSLISGQALNSVLSNNKANIKTNYHRALNLHQRVDQGKYLDFMVKIKSSIDSIKKMEHFIDTNPGTVVARIQKAFDNIVNVTLKDVQNTATEIKQIHDEYYRVDDKKRKYLLFLANEVQNTIENLFYTFQWETNPCLKIEFELPMSLKHQLDKAISAFNALNELFTSYNLNYVYHECKVDSKHCPENTDLSALHETPYTSRSTRMPKKTVLDTTTNKVCQTFFPYKWQPLMKKFEEIIAGLQYVVKLFMKDSYNLKTSCANFEMYGRYFVPNNYFDYDYYDTNYKKFSQYNFFPKLEMIVKSQSSSWQTFLQKLKCYSAECIYKYTLVVTETEELQTDTLAVVNAITPCLTEYGSFLSNAVTWRNNTNLAKYYNVTTATVDTSSLSNIWMHLDLLYRRFTLNNINKADLVEMLINDPKNITFSYITDTIVALKKQFEQEINTPLYTSIDELNVDLNSLYENIIYDMLNYSTYMGDTTTIRGTEYIYMLRKLMPNINSGTFEYMFSPSQVKVIMGTSSFDYMKTSGKEHISEAINSYLLQLKNELYVLYNQYVEMENEVINSLQELETVLQAYKQEMLLDSSFMSNNILQINVFFGELKETEVVQNVGYTATDFFGDLGGFLGLLLGASIVTLVEVMDFLIFKVYLDKKEKTTLPEPIQKTDAMPMNSEMKSNPTGGMVVTPFGGDDKIPLKKQNWCA